MGSKQHPCHEARVLRPGVDNNISFAKNRLSRLQAIVNPITFPCAKLHFAKGESETTSAHASIGSRPSI
jgi:hypothetical protein